VKYKPDWQMSQEPALPRLLNPRLFIVMAGLDPAIWREDALRAFARA
jgi:hypothetical protein